MRDDDVDDWGQGCLGIGSVHEIGAAGRSKLKRAIGFVHFPETPPEKKKRRRARTRDARPKKDKR